MKVIGRSMKAVGRKLAQFSARVRSRHMNPLMPSIPPAFAAAANAVTFCELAAAALLINSAVKEPGKTKKWRN